MNVKQSTIDMMTGVAIRRLGITCSPDVLIALAVQTAEICEKHGEGKITDEHVVAVFDGCITEYLNDNLMRYGRCN